MLSFLRIRGLALLEDVTLELASGMNVLTGETGAGKSIIVDALALLRGGRGRAELVRAGTDAALVDAQFEVAPSMTDLLRGILDRHGLPTGDLGSLVLQRVVPKTGRGRSLVQSELTTQSVLGEVGEHLIDICSQHEHHSLTHVTRHIELLDSFAELEPELELYGSAFRQYREAKAALESLEQRAAEGISRADYLRFQIEELERIAPEPGEHEQLKSKVALMREGQRWAELVRDAEDTLTEAEDAVVGRLLLLIERCRAGALHSQRLASVLEHLQSAELACEEAAHELKRFGSELEHDPGELEAAEERLHLLVALERKHGSSSDQLADRLVAMRTELEELDNADERVSALTARVAELERTAVARARTLHEARCRAAKDLAEALESELGALHLAKARIEARVEQLPDAQLGPRGLDRVEFLFSANPGEPVAPLTRVASGGELSRVLLALKSVLSTGDTVATYVFDEVDAGVGGAVAEAIGRRLLSAASRHQVLCITHLPQIAAFSDNHFRVDKAEHAGRTITKVVRLSREERVEELARMLGGARVTDSARKHARELLDEARRVAQAEAGSGAARSGAPPANVARPAAAERRVARRR